MPQGADQGTPGRIGHGEVPGGCGGQAPTWRNTGRPWLRFEICHQGVRSARLALGENSKGPFGTGSPLESKDFVDFLDKLIEHDFTDMALTYLENALSVYPRDTSLRKLLKKLAKGKIVEN